MGRKDILLDDDGDILIRNGDLVIGDSDIQHITELFEAHAGEFKDAPLAGFGASKYLKKADLFMPAFLRAWRLQLQYDGYNNPNIRFDNNGELITEI